MKVVIISDTSSLIIFSKLRRFDLLANLFDKVVIPQRVFNETLAKEDGLTKMLSDTPLFKVRHTTNLSLLNLLDDVLDHGEAEAITLAKELNLPLLIDEKKGRGIALNLELEVIGFVGVLILNNRQGKLTSKEAQSVLEKAQKNHFRVSTSLQKQFIKRLK